jgi:hypothetical protein
MKTMVKSMSRNVIGRAAIVRSKGKLYSGYFIDATLDNEPKRFRVQSKGQMQGEVLMPHDYTLMEFND